MCLNILVVGDLHLQLTAPKNRIDDIVDAIIAKISEIRTIAKQKEAHAIVITGDIFNSGQVPNTLLLFAFKLFSQFDIPIYTAIGNHDVFNYNIATYERTSLFILSKLLRNFHVLKDSDGPVMFADKKGNKTAISFQEFNNELDREDYNGYAIKKEHIVDDAIQIRVIHGMLLDHTPPFTPYSLIEDVNTNADVIITGHDHHGYGCKKRADGVVFLNPGALLRLSASKNEMKRNVSVGFITIKYKQVNIELINLTSPKPGEEVLNREKIDEAKERTYAMDEFATLLKSGGVDFKVDVLTVLEQVAKIEAIEKRLLSKATQKVLHFMQGGN